MFKVKDSQKQRLMKDKIDDIKYIEGQRKSNNNGGVKYVDIDAVL